MKLPDIYQTDIFISFWDIADPWQFLKEIGVIYSSFEQQLIADQVKFYDCKNIPDAMPTVWGGEPAWRSIVYKR